MWRFIVITFGFLGFAFYELSGGSDYSPSAGSRQALAIEQNKAEEKRLLAKALTKPKAPAPAPVITVASQQPEAAVVLAAAVAPAVAKPSIAQPTTPVIDLAKAEALTSAPVSNPVAEDIREVTGSRVNLRRGPGTDYSAVGKLREGDKVSILGDDGDGWVKLRVVETGRIGYMADFLLTAAN